MKLNYKIAISDTSCLILLSKIDELNIKFTGTFGIILKANKIGIIDSVNLILEKIKATNFRFSEELYEIVLRETKEI